MLTFYNITCLRENKIIFKNLSLTIGEGGLVILRGKNGSGKTSFLEALAGISDSDTGFIDYAGNKFFQDKKWQNKNDYIKNITFFGHQNPIFENLTVAENLKIWAKLYQTEQLLAVAINYFSLNEVVEEKVQNLSQGFKKRVALARIILKDTKIWLLDEPFANLDKENHKKLLDLIATKCDRGGIIVTSNHIKENIPFGDEMHIEDFQCF